jgi:hypothetical protein
MGKIKASRNRIDLASTAPLGDDGAMIMDLFDNDIMGHTDVAVRGQSAEIGRVRGTDGALQRRDIEMYRKAVAAEAQAIGADVAQHVKLFDNLMSQFTEGAFNGGISRNVGRANKLATLSYMAQGGFPALSEVGLVIGTSTIEGMQKHVGKDLKDIFFRLGKDPEAKPLLDSLAHSDVYRSPHELVTSSMELDEVATVSGHDLGKTVDATLDLGNKALGHVSGMWEVHARSQKLAMTTQNMLFYKLAQNSEGISARRLEAYGLDADITRIVNDNLEHFKTNENGAIIDNGFEHWDPADADTYRRGIARGTDWLIQANRRGEGHAWAYTDVGSMFTKLRSFALNALHSKSVRAGRAADKVAAAQFASQLGTAAIAYSAKQALNGNFDRLDAESIASGALNWSAQWSPVMILLDPLAHYAGVDYFGAAGMHSDAYKRRDFGALPTPPAMSAIASILGSGRAPLDLLEDGHLDWKTINDLQAMPVVGRMLGTKQILDLLKE